MIALILSRPSTEPPKDGGGNLRGAGPRPQRAAERRLGGKPHLLPQIYIILIILNYGSASKNMTFKRSGTNVCSLCQARIWVQAMRDLREGVKLKKVQERQYNPLPIEYQLTPYEMLMDDIRSKRYKLRKVMVSPGVHNRDFNDL